MIVERSMVEDIAAALAAHGLILRGGFNFAGGEEAPSGLSGAAARSVLLVGRRALRRGRISCAGGKANRKLLPIRSMHGRAK